MSRPLAGRIALVTGASSGIGEATALHLAALGADVALIARRKDRLVDLAARVQDHDVRSLALAVDLADRAAIAHAATAIAAELGRVDLVVNNAGVMLAAAIEDKRSDDWQRMIDVNINGVLGVIEHFVAPLVAAASEGGPADLVNISSIGAQLTFPNFGVYCATKAFVTHLSKNLRTELGPKRVRVSVIEPGLVTTELQSHVTDPGANAWLEGARAALTWLAPEDVARAIGFLASQPRHVNVQQLTLMPTEQT